MGCDIHAFLEIKVSGTWHYFGQLRLERDYELFAKMAGVRRDDPPPIVPPRGLPTDVSSVTAFQSQSWGWRYPEERQADVEDIRLVFWFDN